MLSMTSCKKVAIEPTNTISGRVHCKQETQLFSVAVQAGARVEGNVNQDGEKRVHVTSDLSFTIVLSHKKKWGCYAIGTYRGHTVKAAVQADPVSLQQLVDRYIDCGGTPINGTITIYDTNGNGYYDKRKDDTFVTYTLPPC